MNAIQHRNSLGNAVLFALLLTLTALSASAQHVPEDQKMAGKKGYEGRGVIYKRIDPITGEAYVGQSWDWETFRKREAKHDADLQKKPGYEGKGYKFEVLSRPIQTELDMVEEGFVRKQGLKKEPAEVRAENAGKDLKDMKDALQNKRHQVKVEEWEAERERRIKESERERIERREAELKRAERRRIDEERLKDARQELEKRRERHGIGR